MKTIRVAAFGWLMLASISAVADDATGFSIRGAGATSCGSYVAARANNEARGYEQFWLGYATAYNFRTLRTYDILGGIDPDGSLLWLENYCREKPLELYFDAIQALIKVLQPSRLKTAPK